MLLFVLPVAAFAQSTCYGTWAKGRLEEGVAIEFSGPNFKPYSSLGVGLGRTHVHDKVAAVIVDAYARVAQSLPDKVFVYGESGWPKGGRIRPHRTHQNGLSVDFMVPVQNADGRSVPLPTSAFNEYGYGIEFDKQGRYKELNIDFEALADHLVAIHAAAQRHGVGIRQVIFEPGYLPRLYRTRHGAFIREHIPFMKGQAWIRHDEHYHIDFNVRCKPLPQ